MSLIESVWRDACELPLKDAAFQLWRYKSRLDEAKFCVPEVDPLNASSDGTELGFMDRLRREHDLAHEGPTFDRLKRAQPHASDEDIREAIKAAVRMMDDCEKYFDRNYTDFGKAIDRALAQARRHNPGFSDTTWQHAGHWLVFVMK